MKRESPSDSVLAAKLKKSDAELHLKFSSLHTIQDVADLLEVPSHVLTYILWRKEDPRYFTWQIRKRSGGFREIEAPARSLKILQLKLAYVLTLCGRVRSTAHAFVPRQSIVTNARQHVKMRWVLNVDLEDFFPSINFGRVHGMFLRNPYKIGRPAATALAQLCCHNRHLPQGAPTSPVVSNMICAKLDADLLRLAKRFGCRYTRYADDITLSCSRLDFPLELAESADEAVTSAGKLLVETVEANGFRINSKKTRLQVRTQRQEVTGLTVNRRPNVRRSFVSQIRAMLHAWERYGYDAAAQDFYSRYDTKHRPNSTVRPDLFEQVIRGKLAFLQQVRGPNDARLVQFQHLFGRLTGKVPRLESLSVFSEVFVYDVFVCHAGEDKKSIVLPLVAALKQGGVNVWLDQGEIRWGDSITGKINEGLANSRFAIVVFSEHFLVKNWPQKEMLAMLSQEIASGIKRVLILLAGSKEVEAELHRKYPLLSDKSYLEWSKQDVGSIVSNLKGLLGRVSETETTESDDADGADPEA